MSQADGIADAVNQGKPPPVERPASHASTLLLWTKGTVAVVLLGLTLKHLAEATLHLLAAQSRGQSIDSWLMETGEHLSFVRVFLILYVLLNSLRFFLASFTADVEHATAPQGQSDALYIRQSIDLFSTLGTMMLVAVSAQAVELPYLHHAAFVFFFVSALDALMTFGSLSAGWLTAGIIATLRAADVLDGEHKASPARDARKKWLGRWLLIDVVEALLWLVLADALYKGVTSLTVLSSVSLVVMFSMSFVTVPDYWRALVKLVMFGHDNREG